MNSLSRRLSLAAVTVVVASAFGCAHHDMSTASGNSAAKSTDTYTGLANSTVSNGAVGGNGVISNTPDTKTSMTSDTTTSSSTMSSGTSSSTTMAANTTPSTPSSVDDDKSRTMPAATAPAPMPTRPARADRN